MNNNFVKFAFIAAVLAFLPSLLPGYLKYLGCLTSIGAIIYMYKLYTDGLEDKTLKSIGLGAKFGLVVGVFTLIFSLIYLSLVVGNLQDYMYEQALIGGATEEQAEMYYTMSDMMIYGMLGIGYLMSFGFSALMGVIAGAIFKHEEA